MISLYFLELVIASDSVLSHSSTIYVWPLSAPSPSPYLNVAYDPISLSAMVKETYQAPLPSPREPESLVRVGIWDAQVKTLRGIVTSAATLDPGQGHIISIHLDDQGSAWHVDLRPFRLQDEDRQGKERYSNLKVELVRPTGDPSPTLNEPVVRDEHGKIPEPELEKSFLQK